MIPLIQDRVELVADGIDELDTTTSRTARVDDKILSGVPSPHTNQRDSEDFLGLIRVARVSRCEVIHGYGEVAALKRVTCDLAARLPEETFAFVSDSSCLMARDGPQIDAKVWYESIEKN